MAGIRRQVTVARDGMHNAFTDLQYWQGAYWVGYRKGAGHVSNDARAVVAVSHDRSRFTEIATARVKGDVRDPKLLPIDDDRMAMYFPSWLEGAGMFERDGRRHYRPLRQHITFSADGHTWEPPRPILEVGQWLWRVRRHDGRYYGLIQDVREPWRDERAPHQFDLAVSDDLIEWETIARVGDGCNESDIVWRADGEAWLVSRTVDKRIGSVFASAKPPYTEWETIDMQPLVHSPVLLEHEGALYVAGRSRPAYEGITDPPYHGASVSVWRVTRGALEPVIRVPAYGDCAYPGLIKDPEGRICMSYYSQHAYVLGVVPRREPTPDLDHPGRAADVYFAELDLP